MRSQFHFDRVDLLKLKMNSYTKKSRLYRGSSTSSGQNFLFLGEIGQKIILKIALLFLVVLSLNVFQSQIKNLFYVISYPISNLFLQSSDGASNFLKGLLNINKLQVENFSLKKENQDLLSQIALLKGDLKESEDLKIVLKNTRDSGFKIKLTKIIGLNLVSDVVIIDKGLDDGILENMPLISAEKVVYGRVLKAYKNFSEVTLISAKHNAFNIKIQPDDISKITTYGVLKGVGDLSVYLDLVDFESEIKEGDILLTSGSEGSFPRDLLVGKVLSVNKSDLKPFQTAEVQPFFDIKNVENLFVITSYPR